MKFYNINILLLIIITGFNRPCHAQEGGASIKGFVLNPNHEPAMYSTVVLLNKDSVFMKGTLSQADGLFVLEKINPGQYLIMIRNLEFETYISEPIQITPNEKFVLDTITLETKINGLNEVVVKGEKALVEVHSDKIVFNVGSSVNATGTNALELIRKAPGVIVDLDKNINLQGKSGVQIYINGRPSRLSGNDLTNMLEGMQSDNIESIELISNPSSKYDAEGTGGIINIVLKKNLSKGFNGSVQGGYSKGKFARSNIGTSLNYSSGKLNLYSTINASNDTYQDDIFSNTRRDLFLLDMKSYSENNRKGYTFSGGLDYTINKQQTLSIDGRALINARDNKLWSTTTINDLSGTTPDEILKAETLDNIPSANYNLNLHYSLVPDRTTNLSADLSAGNYSTTRNTRQPNNYFTLDSGTFINSVVSSYNASTDINLMSAVLDYEKKVNQLTFSGGLKYSYIQTGNNLNFYNIENDSSILDNNRSNNFSYIEKIAAAYFITDAKLSTKWSLNAGIRIENTSSLGTLKSAIPTNDNVVPRNYTSLFPNAGLSFDDQKNNVVSLSIGRRINRPNYQDLNPFESKSSELLGWKGNPFLKPNYITNYQVSYSFKRKLVISNTYSITHDYFANIFISVSDQASIISPRNMQKAINNGLSLSYPVKLFKWWNFSSFFNYNYEKYQGDLEGTIINLHQHIYNFSIQNNLKFPLGISAELTYYYNSPWIWGGSINVNEYHALNFGLKKTLFHDKLQIQVTGNDIFRHSSDFHYHSNYGGMAISGVRSFDNQRYGIYLSYKFGNQQVKGNKRKTSAIDEELKRISD